MAEGFIGLPADGSGKELRTLTGLANMPSGVHQEVMNIAAPDGTVIDPRVPVLGVPKYYSGASGTVTPLAGEKVMAVTCHATSAGTVVIFGGASIPVPANTTFFDTPDGRWVGDGVKTIVFGSTDSYYVRVDT